MRDGRATRRRFMATASAAAAAGLAGCQGTTEDEPAPGDDPSDTTPPVQLTPPPGTGADGIEDPETLVDATEEALEANGYDLTTELAYTGDQSNEITQQIRSNPKRERQLLVFDSESETNEAYVADEMRYYKSSSDGETEYGASELDRPFSEVHAVDQLGSPESLGGILRKGAYEPAGTVEHEGRTVLRFELRAADFDAEGSVESAEGSVLVGPDSVVYDGRLYREIAGSSLTSLSNEFTIAALGDVTVEEPDWVEEAREWSRQSPTR